MSSWSCRWACAFSVALITAAFQAIPAEPPDTSAFDAVMKNALRAWHVPGVAVAVVRGDEVIYLKGFGVKELGSKDPVTPDTLFPVGSCTKAFTTTAMAMLLDEGKMGWDDPVRKHVPFFHLADPLADANVTLRDLVTHRTGLGSNELMWYRSPWSREETIRRIGLVKLKHSFRSTFEYQTTMFTTAGCAVESASKARWEDFVQKRIFDPLGMTGANFTTAAAEKADHAAAHRRDTQGQVGIIPWYTIEHPEPAGSINAGVRDLSKWARFQLGDGTWNGRRLVSAANLEETHTPQVVIRLEGTAKDMNPETTQMSYGMAWVIQDYRGHLLVSHAGAIDGFRSHITLLPNEKLGVVLLNNLDHTQMNLAISNTLVDLSLGLPRRDWNAYIAEQVKKQEAAARERFLERERKRHPGTKPSRDLSAYAGTYENPGYGTAKVSLQDGRLVWSWQSFHGELEHFHYDTFTIQNAVLGDPQVIFALGRAGEVATMKVLDVMDVEFEKQKAKPAANGGKPS